MQHTNTWRGFTQTMDYLSLRERMGAAQVRREEVHNCHPEFISGSTPFVTIPNKEEMLKQVQHDNRHGFTLIELLVVVLIIGILAAVAVPQYTKAVEKSRVAEALVMLASIHKGYQLCVLQHGEEAEACKSTLFSNLDIKLPGEITACASGDPECVKSKNWLYDNEGSGYVYAERVDDQNRELYYLQILLPTNIILCFNSAKNTCTQLYGQNRYQLN